MGFRYVLVVFLDELECYRSDKLAQIAVPHSKKAEKSSEVEDVRFIDFGSAAKVLPILRHLLLNS